MSTQHLTSALNLAREFFDQTDPNLGLMPSFDAVFIAAAGRAIYAAKTASARDTPAPQWFLKALQDNKGARVTIGQFMFLAGRVGANKAERNLCGMWLRAAGRQAKRTGGQQLFTI